MKAFFRPLKGSLLLAACLGVLWNVPPAYAKEAAPKQAPKAQTMAAPSSGANGSIDISADESLEWYQDTGLYVARGKAKAVRGDSVIEADILTAHQREKDAASQSKAKQANESAGGLGGDLDYLTAEGNVRISDPKQQVFGQKAVYDLDKKVVKITGSNLKYVTEKDVVTARDSLEYFEDRDMAVARGRAVALHQDSRIEADVLAAMFAPAQTGGGKELSEIKAKGNVIIVTKDGGVSRGDWATYDAKRDVAVLHDHVRITRGDTQLSGDTAEVNFATGQSRLLNSGSGRVRALLPGSRDKDQSGKANP